MIAELGFFFLCLALSMACLQCVIIFFIRKNSEIFFRKTLYICWFHFAFITLSFLSLILLFVQSDFSIAYVSEHSHHLLPIQYKIAASWSGHEGSMILWVFILAFFSLLVSWFETSLPKIVKADVLATQALISITFYVFIIITSNPFERLSSPLTEGVDLNSALQDPGLAIHPPLLYLGYVGYSIAFSFAIAALINNQFERNFAKAMKPWLMLAWSFLSLGIACGSYWAYYTLGWGGFWFWDPVENVSLLPWLAGTALLHSVNVSYKRGQLKSWTIFLSMLAFIMSLIGTFIVRSGILTSVHAFASDPERGLFILIIISFFSVGSILLYSLKMPKLDLCRDSKQGFSFVSREGALVLNNLLLVTLLVTVFIGTVYPLIIEALTDDKITVGAPYFNITCLPILIIISLVLPFAIYQPWIKGSIIHALKKLWLVIIVAIIFIYAMVYTSSFSNILSCIEIGIASYIILSSIKVFVEKIKINKLNNFIPLFAMTIAHIGIGIFLIGLSGIGWSEEKIVKTVVGQDISINDYDISLKKINEIKHQNTNDIEFHFDVRKAGVLLNDIAAIKRQYISQQAPTNIIAIETINFSQLYIALGNISPDGSVTVRIYWKELILMIWLGFVFMALGGLISLVKI